MKFMSRLVDIIRKSFKPPIKRLLRSWGYDVVRLSEIYPELSPDDIRIICDVKPYTLTDFEKIWAMIEGTRYVIRNNIPGDFVECGVWKGGSVMAIAKTLVALGDYTRHIHLFDTFEGMSQPEDRDITCGEGIRAGQMCEASELNWTCVDLDTVKSNIYGIGYDNTKIHFIKGKVEETLPEHAPDRISLLRLDTDWYKSTHHELIHLYPRLSVGGIIIVDDYGAWQGARQAVDEYVQENDLTLFLTVLERTGRIGVKIKP
jgi:O-methyltransferase